MRTSKHVLVTCAAAALVGSLLPSPGRACSAPYCAGKLAPVLSEDGSVPANLGELTFYGVGPFPYAVGYDVRLWEVGDPAHILFTGAIRHGYGESVLPFDARLEAGHAYVVEATPNCPLAGADTEAQPFVLEVTAAAEPPASLGPLRLVQSGSAQVPIGGGAGCWEDYASAAADVELDRTQLPEAWRELLTHYQLMVDGEPFSWPMTTGGYGPERAPRAFYFGRPGVFRAWTRCEPAPDGRSLAEGVTPGKHTLWVRARVPTRESVSIESERLEVEISCPAEPQPDGGAEPQPDGGAEPQPDGGAEPQPDGGAEPQPDGGAEPQPDGGAGDAEPDGASSERALEAGGAETTTYADGGACSVDPGRSPRGGSAAALLLAVGLASLARVRARRR